MNARHFIAVLLLAALARPAAAITPEEILELSRAGVTKETIVRRILAEGTVFDLSPMEVIALEESGVDPLVIQVMLETSMPPERRTPLEELVPPLPERPPPVVAPPPGEEPGPGEAPPAGGGVVTHPALDFEEGVPSKAAKMALGEMTINGDHPTSGQKGALVNFTTKRSMLSFDLEALGLSLAGMSAIAFDAHNPSQQEVAFTLSLKAPGGNLFIKTFRLGPGASERLTLLLSEAAERIEDVSQVNLMRFRGKNFGTPFYLDNIHFLPGDGPALPGPPRPPRPPRPPPPDVDDDDGDGDDDEIDEPVIEAPPEIDDDDGLIELDIDDEPPPPDDGDDEEEEEEEEFEDEELILEEL